MRGLGPSREVSRSVYIEALHKMEGAFRRLEAQIPPPQFVRTETGLTLRYVEQYLQQAIIQKLARQISGLWAIDTLLLNGFVQEQCVLQRTLDELGDDIWFLALAAVTGEVTDLHKRYLSTFWEEEFDKTSALESTQKRDIVPRKKIHAYLARHGAGDESGAIAVSHTIHKGYSGYVHAASPHVMDMCGGNPPRFHLRGLVGTPRMPEHIEDAWNYFYRALINVTVAAKAFSDAEVVSTLNKYLAEFEAKSGAEYSREA